MSNERNHFEQLFLKVQHDSLAVNAKQINDVGLINISKKVIKQNTNWALKS